ncbi:mtDNA inheritance, partitioning of the mitochondrial organelle [Coemansia erecta]|nr:mtDNA inheritance, partitioning of the mitochondrial organelle [Coemansia erecta]
MREVITLQFGENANYVGAHFWNLQDAYTDDGRVHELFAERSNAQPTPRVLVFDAAANYGSLATEESLQSLGNDQLDKEQALWSGQTEVHRQPLHAKHPIDPNSPSQQNVRFWSDIGQTKYAPHSVHVVSGVEFGNSLGEMNTHQEGMSVFAGTDGRSDMLEGGFRVFAEECDHLQGFHVLSDAFGGFGGFSSGFLARVRDEYPKAPIVLYSVGRTEPTRRLRGAQLMDAAVSVAANTDVVSMHVPLFAPSSQTNACVEMADADFSQISSLMAANVAQTSHCLQEGRRVLDEIVGQVTQQEYYPLAETLLAPGLCVPDIDSRSSTNIHTQLAEADRLVESSFVGCSTGAVSQVTTTFGQLIVDRGTNMSSLISDRYPAWAYLRDTKLVQLPRAFPQIFPRIGRHGFQVDPSVPHPTADVKQLCMAGMLCTSGASLGYLAQLHASMQTEHSRHFKDYERETVREYRGTLDRAIDKYSAL